MNERELESKIILGLPLTRKEYSYAVLYMNLDPKAYVFKKENYDYVGIGYVINKVEEG